MRYLAVACDYDGTLAENGKMSENTVAALRRLRSSGRKLLMVTGRELEDLKNVCPHLDLFNLIVAENGALLYDPESKSERLLADPPPPRFVAALKEKKVEPLSIGRAIVATWTPHETTALQVIRDLGLELQVIFNKGAVMVLPSGVNKGTGLKAALRQLGLSEHNVIGIGDAENDHAFLNICEFSVAVANALDSLKERADMVTKGSRGAGVAELIAAVLDNDLRGCGPARRKLLLGHRPGNEEVRIDPYGPNLLIAGPSGSGKSSVLAGLLESIRDAGYQFCLIDPEGDFEQVEGTVTVGSATHPPALAEVLNLIDHLQNSVINMLGLPLNDRPAYFASLLPQLQERRALTGRPHWLIIDEAHHLLPQSWQPAPVAVPQQMFSTILVTVHPDHVSEAVLKAIEIVLAVGKEPLQTVKAFAEAAQVDLPEFDQKISLEKMQALSWFREKNELSVIGLKPGEADRQRHRRKYAEGDIHEKSFHFRGPENKLNLRAQNLSLFLQIAEGIDDETWMFHLDRQDYSNWIRIAIKDEPLAMEVARIESAKLSPAESRNQIKSVIERQYTSAA